ncbi:MAG: sigma-70 family RNA polymerase sigma factor [Sulfurimonadaceae bacterium]
MFASLYEKFRHPLLRFVRYKTNDLHLAEDIVQEVFIKAYQSIDTLKEKEKFQSWLFAIASNTIKDYYKKQHIAYTDAVDITQEETLQESVLQELDCCLVSFIQTLSPAQRNILQALYFQEYTLEEYATTNDLNLSTVKSHAKRAKTTLKELLEACCTFEKNSRDETVDFAECKKINTLFSKE